MTVIYQFSDYRTTRLSKILIQQNGAVVIHLSKLKERCTNFGDFCESIEDVQRECRSHHDTSLLMLEESRDFSCRCLAACELESIEKMVEKRDQLIQCRHKQMGC